MMTMMMMMMMMMMTMVVSFSLSGVIDMQALNAGIQHQIIRCTETARKRSALHKVFCLTYFFFRLCIQLRLPRREQFFTLVNHRDLDTRNTVRVTRSMRR
jgi:hypothetical protein